MTDAQFYEALMFATFLDWLDMELGYCIKPTRSYLDHGVEEDFKHYSFLATCNC